MKNVRVVLSLIVAYAMITLSFFSLHPKARWAQGFLWLVDILIAGSNTARWGLDGWQPIDQKRSDVYQAIYACVVVATIIWVIRFVSLIEGLKMLTLYLAYGEDINFYAMMPALRWATALINQILFGKWLPFQMPEGIIKKRISGWMGWAGRTGGSPTPYYLTRWEALTASMLGALSAQFFSREPFPTWFYLITVGMAIGLAYVFVRNNRDFWDETKTLENALEVNRR